MDAFLKIKWLFTVFILPAFDDWKSNLWRKDLDSRYCCDGHECGCYGTTYREMYSRKVDR